MLGFFMNELRANLNASPEQIRSRNIPELSMKNLRKMDDVRENWKEEFYIRHIKEPIELAIRQDIEGSTEERIIALRRIVERSEKSERNQITDYLDGFEQVANQSLPGFVTAKLNDSINKEIIQSCYENLILLEVVYEIEKLAKDDVEDAVLKTWIEDKKRILASPRSSFSVYVQGAFQRVDNFFQLSALASWVTKVEPYFLKTYVQHVIKGAKKASYFQIDKNLVLATLEAGHLMLTPLLGLAFRLSLVFRNSVNLPVNAVLDFIKQNISTTSRLHRLLTATYFAKECAIIYAMTTIFLPYALPIAGYSIATYLSGIIAGGLSLFGLRKLFQNTDFGKYFELTATEQEESLTLSFLKRIITVIAPYFSNAIDLESDIKEMITFYRTHEKEMFVFFEDEARGKKILNLIDTVALFKERSPEEAPLSEEEMKQNKEKFIQALSTVLNDVDAYQKQIHLMEQAPVQKIVAFSTKLVPILQENGLLDGDITEENWKEKIIIATRKCLGIELVAPLSISEEEYNQQAMCKTLLRLKAQYAQDQTPSELKDLLTTINPITYCQAHPKRNGEGEDAIHPLLRPYLPSQEEEQSPNIPRLD